MCRKRWPGARGEGVAFPMSDVLRYATQGGVATLELNRPERLQDLLLPLAVASRFCLAQLPVQLASSTLEPALPEGFDVDPGIGLADRIPGF